MRTNCADLGHSRRSQVKIRRSVLVRRARFGAVRCGALEDLDLMP